MSTNAQPPDETAFLNTEYKISLKPHRIDGYVQWQVEVTAVRPCSHRPEVLMKQNVPYLYPNAVEVIQRVINNEQRARYA